MANPDLEAEIKDIEAQLANLKQQRTTKNTRSKSKAGTAAKAPEPEADGNASAENLADLEALLAEFDAQDAIDFLSTHARDWLGAFNEDLKHSKPSTLITLFGLGVLVGRLTK